jgi:hypothetical protein
MSDSSVDFSCNDEGLVDTVAWIARIVDGDAGTVVRMAPMATPYQTIGCRVEVELNAMDVLVGHGRTPLSMNDYS